MIDVNKLFTKKEEEIKKHREKPVKLMISKKEIEEISKMENMPIEEVKKIVKETDEPVAKKTLVNLDGKYSGKGVALLAKD